MMYWLLIYERGIVFFINDYEVQILYDNEKKVIYGEYIVIVVGSCLRKDFKMDVDEQMVMIFDGIENLMDYLKSFVIVGVGVIGCEYVMIFFNFGCIKVYLIDCVDCIFFFEDEDVLDVVLKNFEDYGVMIYYSVQLERLDNCGDYVEYEIFYLDGCREII